MTESSREARIGAAFIALADTLTADYDLIDLMHSLVEVCVDVLDVQAGGLMLADPDGALQRLASTGMPADLVEIAQIDAGAGPSFDCFGTGAAVAVADVAEAGDRWPGFRAAALGQGFRSALVTPMRLRGQVLGTMNLFGVSAAVLNPPDAAVAQALADVATIGILHERSIREKGIVADQLRLALESRIVIEQAKGIVAATGHMGVDAAFALLRAHARRNNLTLRSVAERVTARTLDLRP